MRVVASLRPHTLLHASSSSYPLKSSSTRKRGLPTLSSISDQTWGFGLAFYQYLTQYLLAPCPPKIRTYLLFTVAMPLQSHRKPTHSIAAIYTHTFQQYYHFASAVGGTTKNNALGGDSLPKIKGPCARMQCSVRLWRPPFSHLRWQGRFGAV
jgi:hypothetical protein